MSLTHAKGSAVIAVNIKNNIVVDENTSGPIKWCDKRIIRGDLPKRLRQPTYKKAVVVAGSNIDDWRPADLFS